MAGLSRKEIIESVKQSLMNLGMEYIDLVIIHKCDPNCPIEGNKTNQHFSALHSKFFLFIDFQVNEKSYKELLNFQRLYELWTI